MEKKLTLFMPVGLPGSGKSTWAEEHCKATKGAVKRVSRDMLRRMIDPGGWTEKQEKHIRKLRDAIINKTLEAGHSIIVDDTNLDPKVQAHLGNIAESWKAELKLVDFRDVEYDICVARDLRREYSVGKAVIHRMFLQYLCATAPAPQEDLPDAVLCDLDGTLATNTEGRGWFDWARVGEDTLVQHVAIALRGFRDNGNTRIIFLSGRDGVCEQQTMEWLARKGFNTYSALFMRAPGDQRKDAIVKREIYDREIAGKYNVRAIFDDRPQVIRMWQSLGYADRIFNMGSGVEF